MSSHIQYTHKQYTNIYKLKLNRYSCTVLVFWFGNATMMILEFFDVTFGLSHLSVSWPSAGLLVPVPVLSSSSVV